MKRYFALLVQSYIFIAVISLLAGLLFADELAAYAYLGTVFLQIIFFLSALKIDFEALRKAAGAWKSLIVVNLFMLIVLPALTYVIALLVVPQLAVALMLLAAMPAGLTTPLLTEVVKGNMELSLILTITTSLLAPITIPLVLAVLIGAQVELSLLEMFLKLVNILVVPFVVALITKRFFHVQVSRSMYTFKPISLLLLGGLIAVLVAPQADYILEALQSSAWVLLVMIVFYILLHVAGYYLTPWLPHADRVTVAVSVTYMNFVLSLFIASEFIKDPVVMMALVVQIVPWALMLIPFKYMINKINGYGLH